MKKFVMILFVLCAAKSVMAQPQFEEVITANGQGYLIGVLEKEMLQKGAYKSWFDPNYASYQPDDVSLKSLGPLLQEIHILVFLGTWCGDSRREVPRFLRILDAADFPSERLKLVGVDRRKEHYKQSPGGEQWGLNIRRVPTFIFLRNGQEIGRIVERPAVSLEQDICDILSCSPSIPRANE